MAFRLALSLLVAATVFGNTFAYPNNFRLSRAAAAAAALKTPVPSPSVKSAAVVVPAAPSAKEDKMANIVSQTYDFNPADGSYSYGYESDNGISSKAHGYMKDGKLVIEGSYTLYTKEGFPVSITYVADENGFNAVGDSIPTPDPAIAKAIEYLKSLPPQPEEKA